MHFSCSAPFSCCGLQRKGRGPLFSFEKWSISEVTTTRFSWNSTNLPRWGEAAELPQNCSIDEVCANWCFVKASFLIYEVRVVWMSIFFPASWNTPFELSWSGGYSFSMPVPFHQRCLGAKISVSLCFTVFPHLIPSTICFSFASRSLIFFPGSKLHALRGTLQGGTWATRSWCPRQWKSRTE